MTLYVIYMRVSTVEQAATHLGLDSQLRRCHEYVTKKGGHLIGSYEEVASGGFKTPRPICLAAIAKCKTTGATLLISELDRLGRSLAFLTMVRQQGIAIESVQHGTMSTMVFGMYATMAERERELISTRTKAGMARAREAGIRLGSPVGFKNGSTQNRANQDRREQAASHHAAAIRVLKVGRLDGETFEVIAERLGKYEFKTQSGLPYTAAKLRQLWKRVEAPA